MPRQSPGRGLMLAAMNHPFVSGRHGHRGLAPAVVALMVAAGTAVAAGPAAPPPAPAVDAEPAPPPPVADPDDPIRMLQCEAELSGVAPWGHWGDQPGRYVTWSNHSNRLIPVYSFGIGLESLPAGPQPLPRRRPLPKPVRPLPADTLNPEADYFDQTDVHRLQLAGGRSRHQTHRAGRL